MAKIHVVVLMGGPSPEYDISLLSGKHVIANLDQSKYDVASIMIPRNKENWTTKITGIKADVIFIAMHGPYGEDGRVQEALDSLAIPYTGSGAVASATGMNKIAFRRIVERAGVPGPKWIACLKKNKIPVVGFDLPWVVKPANQGSSVGVSIVKNKTELKDAMKKAFGYDKEILIEEYLKGTEISCGVLGNDNPVALPVVEICPKKPFFDYEAKYSEGMSEEIVPARISNELTKKVQDLAIKVFKTIGGRGFARVDMIIKNETPYVLEINTIPGLTPASLLPKEALAAGLNYSQLLDKIISLALEKN